MMKMRKGAALVVMVMICFASNMGSLVAGTKCPPPPNAHSSPSHYSPPKSPSGGSGGSGGSGSGSGSCPLNALKLGACVDVLGGLVHVGLGDPAVNTCCPVLQGVLELEAALCLCTTIRAKLLNLNIILPIALEIFVQCGLNPPPGFKCPPLN